MTNFALPTITALGVTAALAMTPVAPAIALAEVTDPTSIPGITVTSRGFTPRPQPKATKKTPVKPKSLAMRCVLPAGTKLSGTKVWPARVKVRIKAQFKIATIGGYRGGSGTSDHHSGYALDVMTYKSYAKGDAVAAWTIKNYKKLNVKYVIWKQRIWLPSSKKWRHMSDRGGVTANHFDHVHISFNKGTGTCPA